MNLNKLYIILIAFMLSTTCYSQELTLKDNQQYQINHLGNKYLIDNRKMLDINQATTKVYQNQFLGSISHVDIRNPLRILLYFKESNTIVYLNQELSEIGEHINLDESANIDVLGLCSSVTNGFWIFNGFSKRLEYYNEKVQLIHSSEIIEDISVDEDQLMDLQMYSDMIYLASPNGIFVFDIYGSYVKTLPIIKPSSFQVLENGLLYTKDNSINFYSFIRLETSLIKQSTQKLSYARLFNKNLYFIENQTEKVLNIKKLAL